MQSCDTGNILLPGDSNNETDQHGAEIQNSWFAHSWDIDVSKFFVSHNILAADIGALDSKLPYHLALQSLTTRQSRLRLTSSHQQYWRHCPYASPQSVLVILKTAASARDSIPKVVGRDVDLKRSNRAYA